MKSIIAAVLALVALAAIVTTIPVNAQFNGCGPGLCNGIGGSGGGSIPGIPGALLLEDSSSILLLEDNASSLCLEGGC